MNQIWLLTWIFSYILSQDFTKSYNRASLSNSMHEEKNFSQAEAGFSIQSSFWGKCMICFKTKLISIKINPLLFKNKVLGTLKAGPEVCILLLACWTWKIKRIQMAFQWLKYFNRRNLKLEIKSVINGTLIFQTSQWCFNCGWYNQQWQWCLWC